jgi:5-methylcytosine-specific restriction enzyme subunit McrC
LEIIEVLMQGEGIALEDQVVDLPGFMFDMNHFFQMLLSRFLKDHLVEYSIIDEYRLKGMMGYVSGFKPQRRSAPVPRPDFLVRQENRPIAVLDAKYRDLWENSLPRGMLYQLAIDGLSQKTERRAVILYPTMTPQAREQRIEIREPVYGKGQAEVVLRPVDLEVLEKLILAGRREQRKRERNAKWMVWGGSKG